MGPPPAQEVWRLSGAHRFASLRSTPHRSRFGPLRLFWVPVEASSPPRVGFSISTRVGSAVVRNRLRRRLRAAVSELPLPDGDYLLAVEPAAAALHFSDLKALVSNALQALPSHENQTA